MKNDLEIKLDNELFDKGCDYENNYEDLIEDYDDFVYDSISKVEEYDNEYKILKLLTKQNTKKARKRVRDERAKRHLKKASAYYDKIDNSRTYFKIEYPSSLSNKRKLKRQYHKKMRAAFSAIGSYADYEDVIFNKEFIRRMR